MESTGLLQWSKLDLAEQQERRKALTVADEIMPTEGIGARHYSLEWKAGHVGDWQSVHAYVLREGNTAIGFVPFLRRERPLKLTFGEFTIAAPRLARFWMTGDLHFAPSVPPERSIEFASMFLDAVVPNLGRHEALFFEGLPEQGHLHAALRQDRARNEAYTVLQLGDTYEHQFIKFPPSLDEYMLQLGSRSRQSLRNSTRRLEKEMDGAVRVECFEQPESVSRFAADASAISRKTYQWNLLDLGFRDSEGLRTRLRWVSEHGWFRSYIMYCRDVPVAFMWGHQFGDCYYIDDGGYDPDYAKLSVGSVLQLKLIEHLFAGTKRPRFLDFSTGFGTHKGRFGNFSRRELNVLILPATLRNRLLKLGYVGTDSLSKGTVRLIDRIGLKAKIKRLIRRSSAQPAD